MEKPNRIEPVESVETPEVTETPAASASEKKPLLTPAGVFEWLDPIVASIIAVVLAFTFLVRVVGIDGASMNDTLEDGDRVIVYHLFYTPKVGDIVVISRNVSNEHENLNQGNGPIIKRVVAVAGDTVDIRYEDGVGYVYVNGVLRSEPYIKEYISQYKSIPAPIDFPATVPEGCVFVMGDNRNNSEDSRFADVGFVPLNLVKGKAMLVFWPFDAFKTLP